MKNVHQSSAFDTTPKDYLAGLKQNWKSDIFSGFVVFLIALPLCLGIAIASGVPPLSGIIAAVVGGIVVGLLSGSYVTINGPAAGLIVVILGAVEQLGQGDPVAGYRAMLAAVVCGGVFLILAGFLRAGRFATFFPLPAVHGMLAAIGLIIISKQIHVLLGVKPSAKEPVGLFLEIPQSLLQLNPWVTVVGAFSLLLLILLNQPRLHRLKKIPPPLWVAILAAGLAYGFQFHLPHHYTFAGSLYELSPEKVLVTLPAKFSDAITFPDFSRLGEAIFWQATITIALVQGIETLLSASAVDLLDKYKRQSNLSRDLSAVGAGTIVSGLLGGLPMIAEIVRSSANIDNGAKTRWSNFLHGTFLLVFCVLAPGILHYIPFTALAALLIFTGYRLTAPHHFIETYKIGREQFLIFTVTIITTLATDLLIGIATGIVFNLLINLYYGVRPQYWFKNPASLKQLEDKSYVLTLRGGVTFCNIVPLKATLERVLPAWRLTIDCNAVQYIDHTVLSFLHQYCARYNSLEGDAKIIGLECLRPVSQHPLAARVAPPALDVVNQKFSAA